MEKGETILTRRLTLNGAVYASWDPLLGSNLGRRVVLLKSGSSLTHPGRSRSRCTAGSNRGSSGTSS